MSEITDLDATALSALIHSRQASCREVMQAYLARIQALNPQANAIVNLAPEAALLEQADARDREIAQGRSRGWLHGVPQALKDAVAVAGFPTTQGSRLLRHAVANEDGLVAARMKAAGAIVIGKTNMPEMGLGSHTFNELFGPTPNSWDAAVSAGGSSGGAAVALAHRLLPVADGSDFMGSLRNPAGWNHVFGMRPSQGRVPMLPASEVWISQMVTEGPMARSVRDLAQLLAIQAGAAAQAPLSNPSPLAPFSPPHDTSGLRGLRIGWLGDLGGHLAIEDGILPVCEVALRRFAEAGAIVEPTQLGFDAGRLWEAWLIWRRALVGHKVAALLELPQARETLKAEALWEHDQAQSLSFTTFMKASEVRTAFHLHLLELFERFDMLALPVAQTWPFPIAQRWPQSVAGRTMHTYHQWMEVTTYATFAGLPAISLPAGFHSNGRWPMGLQLIGRPQADAALLQAAAGYELGASELLKQRPASRAL